MFDTKSLLASKTFWGAVATFLVTVGPVFLNAAGITDPSTQQMFIQMIGGLITTLFTMYGRFAATKEVTTILPKPTV